MGNRPRPLLPSSERGGASLKGQGSKSLLSSLGEAPLGGGVAASQRTLKLLNSFLFPVAFQADLRLLHLQVPLLLQRGHGCPSGEQVPQRPLQVSVQPAVEANHGLPAGTASGGRCGTKAQFFHQIHSLYRSVSLEHSAPVWGSLRWLQSKLAEWCKSLPVNLKLSPRPTVLDSNVPGSLKVARIFSQLTQ